MNKISTHIKQSIRSIFDRWQVLLHDTCMVPLAWLAAYWLRYNMGVIPEVFRSEALSLLPAVMAIQFSAFIFIGTHRGLWRFTSTHDLWQIIKAAAVGTIFIAMGIFFVTRLIYVPRSVFIFYALSLIFLLCLSRLFYRLIKEQSFRTAEGQKAMIVGAGIAAEQVIRDLRRSTNKSLTAIIAVDDDVNKVGQRIRGVPVVSTCDQIPQICEKWPIDLIIIAIPSASDSQMQRIVEFCEQTKVQFRTLPAIQDVIAGRVSLNDMREVRIEDLLGREQVKQDWINVKKFVEGKRVLVTGGGGSIGSELCRQVALAQPSSLTIYEQSEFNLYQIHKELVDKHARLNIMPVLGDVCDDVAVDRIFKTVRPDIVFHAAAYKHVPLLQAHIREAAKNNVMGTYQIAKAADRYAAEKFVFISTDKAVNPGNWLGVSKRVAEIICQSMSNSSQTQFDIVRFGNVLGSAGSVVPQFKQQIKDGGPVTVTHPDITRYFMTIKEATQLILDASSFNQGGNVYVLDMGHPVNISFLAEQMIKLSGKTPNRDIQIIYTGLRPGEKLAEELFYPGEKLGHTPNEKIFKSQIEKIHDYQDLDQSLKKLAVAVKEYNESEIASILIKLVPSVRNEICKSMPNYNVA